MTPAKQVFLTKPANTQRNPLFSLIACAVSGFMFFFLYSFILELHLVDTANTLASSNREQAMNILAQTQSLPFTYDIALIAKEYADIQNAELAFSKKQTPIAETAYARAIDLYDKAIALHPLKAQYYYFSSICSYLHATSSNTPVPQVAIQKAEKAKSLAPARVEAIISLANIYDTNGNADKAMELAQYAHRIAPTEPKTLWTLALFYLHRKNIDQAAPLAIQSLQHGLKLVNPNSLGWLVSYYYDKHDTQSIVQIYEYAYAMDPNQINLLPKLAAAYAANGQKEKAIETAQRLLQQAPESKPQVDAFIQSLQ